PVRFHRPLRSTSAHAFSSLSRICGQEEKRRSRTGAPPSSAGLSIGLGPAARAVAEAAARNPRRVFLVFIDQSPRCSRAKGQPGKRPPLALTVSHPRADQALSLLGRYLIGE